MVNKVEYIKYESHCYIQPHMMNQRDTGIYTYLQIKL